MKLLIQPGDGVLPLVKAIGSAKKSIEIVIFRFDQREIERALGKAVSRGVAVQALIAHTNRAGEENLRKLELRLLEAGVTVSRTADDLVRYHGKFMIIDRKELYVLAFNLTLLDIERSRSFGIVTRNRSAVAEAVRLFEADSQRIPYEPGPDSLVVSPVNARARLAALIKRAKKEILIYDIKVSDQAMIRLLAERAKAGVDIKIIGRLTHKTGGVEVCKLPQLRLHARAMVVDRRFAFVGSQSLREIELEARREVGIIVRDPKIVNSLAQVFEEDWVLTEKSDEMPDEKPVIEVARKVAKVVTRELPPVMPVLHEAVKDVVGDKAELELDSHEVEEIVKGAVKEAVREALRNVVEEAVEDDGEETEKANA